MSSKNILQTVQPISVLTIAPAAGFGIPDLTSLQTGGPAKTESSADQQLLQRLEDIKVVNKSGWTGLEKRNLQKEVKEIKRKVKAIKDGVCLFAEGFITRTFRRRK